MVVMVGWAVTVAWAVFISGDGGWAVACLVGGGGGLACVGCDCGLGDVDGGLGGVDWR